MNAVSDLDIAPLQADELAAVAALEADLHDGGWTLRQFADSLANSHHHASVVHAAGEVIAYMVHGIVCDEAELLTLGVVTGWQRRGIGSRLLDHLFAEARVVGCTQVFLEVRASNAAARALYARHGFVQVGLRSGYYATGTGREDALVLRAEP